MLYLASKSPRRRELIAKLGIPFEVCPANASEDLPPRIAPMDAVELLARRKCEAGASDKQGADFVVGADTLVFLDGEPLGKPRDPEDAFRMLKQLSGTVHSVCTGVAVWHEGVLLSGARETLVSFRTLTDREIMRYVKTGEPMDKAGAYGIQGKGGKLVASYRGDFDNVIGLPVDLVGELIETQKKRAHMAQVCESLQRLYPEAECALRYEGDPWRLLVMGRLSAQCTDKRVNEVSVSLFQKYPTPEAMANADLEELAEAVRPCGLFRTKAQNLKAASEMLVREYGGVLPDTMEELLRFPGVGRKIANLLLGDIFGKPAIVTDTHFIRICARLGAYEKSLTDPYKIEKRMQPLLAPEESADFCHRIVLFGREICTARSPKCTSCPLASLCAHPTAKVAAGNLLSPTP